ncbi:hypothetical protein ZTR_10425 [Talaromyces verruculosus]|nr:hypothetical protein ZTR_10425 [Talaromyces verruculosus]
MKGGEARDAVKATTSSSGDMVDLATSNHRPELLFFDQHDTSVGSHTDIVQHRSRASAAPELLWPPDDFTNAISSTNSNGLKLFNDMKDIISDSISNSVGLQTQSKSKQSSERHSVSNLSCIIQDPKTAQEWTPRCGSSKFKGKTKECANQIQQLSKSSPTPRSLKNTFLPLNLDSSRTQSTVPVSGNIGILPSGNISRHIGKTALHISAERGNLSIVQFLLLAGVDINGTDGLGRTALHYAAHSGSLEVALQLLTAGADLDIQDHEGQSPLHLAADAECEAMVRFLAQEGADLNAAIGCSEDISSGEEDNDTCEATWS